MPDEDAMRRVIHGKTGGGKNVVPLDLNDLAQLNEELEELAAAGATTARRIIHGRPAPWARTALETANRTREATLSKLRYFSVVERPACLAGPKPQTCPRCGDRVDQHPSVEGMRVCLEPRHLAALIGGL